MENNNFRKELYVDGVNRIHYLGNMIRFDFVSLDYDETNETGGKADVVQRVIMTPQTFIGLFSSMQQLMDQLVEKGVVGEKE